MKSVRMRKTAVVLLGVVMTAALFISSHMGYYLTLRSQEDGTLYARYRLGEGEQFSVTFLHSVNLYPLSDIYEIHDKTIYVEACKYYSFGAGVQTELNPGEQLSYTEDGAMLITNIHQDRTGVGYIVGTVYDHVLALRGKEISLRDLCGRNAHIFLNYEFFVC